jgi:hypothetical protein
MYMAGCNHLGVPVEEPAASEEFVVPEAKIPELAAVADTVEEVVAANEASTEDSGADGADEAGPDDAVDEASSADTNEVSPDDAGGKDVAAAEVVFVREIENPRLNVCVLIDELYAIMDELYDWAMETVVETVTEVVIVT